MRYMQTTSYSLNPMVPIVIEQTVGWNHEGGMVDLWPIVDKCLIKKLIKHWLASINRLKVYCHKLHGSSFKLP